jgi:2-keto-4-pentenoate hydratase/2-oxohepta-3-ene-1,7-dioic acid hydratase in catechol pathway
MGAERERFAPVRQRLIRVHPSTGRKSLFLASHAGGIVGWPTDEAPDVDANVFHHKAELVVVFGRAGGHIPEAQAMEYVFGFTCGVDVSARMPPPLGSRGIDRTRMPVTGHKSYNGFSPLGPWIASVDEIGNPEKLDVKLWVGGELGPNFNTSDLAHSIAESIAWATALTPVQPGDVLFMGTNHQGLGGLESRPPPSRTGIDPGQPAAAGRPERVRLQSRSAWSVKALRFSSVASTQFVPSGRTT